MQKAISAAFVLAAVIAASSVANATAPAKHSPAAKRSPVPASKLATMPPEITHVVSRPFCTALRNNIGPAIGAVLQNDRILKAGPGLFDEYNRANGNGEMSKPRKDMTLVKMENMVQPLVGNLATVEKSLQDNAAFRVPPHTADEKRLLDLRKELYEAVAYQQVQLDIVNGFVQTQQLGDLQHADEGMISQFGADSEHAKSSGPATPNPLYNDPNQAGLAPDPHFIDPTTIPGLSLGYNPISHLNAGLKWVQGQTAARENAMVPHIMDAVHLCNGAKAPAPAASPAATP